MRSDSPDRDSYESYLYMCRCLRVEFEAGRKLTPAEMVERADEMEKRA